MCQYSCEDGFATDWHLVHLGSRAVGGAGLVIAEATAVSPEGRISPGDLGLWKDEQIQALSPITKFIRSQGSASGVQIAHAGRKASTAAPWNGGKYLSPAQGGWEPVAPSPLAFDAASAVPNELNGDGIKSVVHDFQDAARRADLAGFDVVEIHAAHGYLLHEFLSPLSNRRIDAYGGSFENRTRLVRETVAAVRQVWPGKKPLFVRLSATDWMEPEGWTADQTVELCKTLAKMGVDLIDTSSAALVPNARIPAGPLFQVPFAERIKKEAGIATGAVGFITTAAQADAIVREGKADAVLMAREFLYDPYFPLHAARELGVDMTWPKQYGRGKKNK
jgi:2,4-dienoyl-CoA reductase-like NADH-dependent reductase (Old Yellow Enzyme family)